MSAVATLPARAVRRPRPTFTGALRSELLKIGRQRLTWVLVAVLAAITAILMAVFATASGERQTLATQPGQFYYVFRTGLQQAFCIVGGAILLVAAARLVSMEYGSGTIRLVLARGTGRLTLLTAQYTALAITGLLLLAGFVLISAVYLCVLVLAWQGSLAPLTGLPAAAWTDTALCVVVALVSIVVCVLLGTAGAVVGRSVAFAMGVAIGFFPADNFGVIVLGLLTRITGQQGWSQATQWLLGPCLNRLPGALMTDHPPTAAFATPLVPVDATHCWIVIGAWSLLFLAAAIVLTWRRDIVH